MFVDKNTQYSQELSSSKLIYGFNVVQIKTMVSYFMDIDKPF